MHCSISPGAFSGVYLYRRLEGLITMFERPLNCLVYTDYTVTKVLQLFHTRNRFTHDLLHDYMCPIQSGLHPVRRPDHQSH
jgi:hypothetical protein